MNDYERARYKERLKRINENHLLEDRCDSSEVIRVTVHVDDYAPLGYVPTERTEEGTEA